jgi:hypothetical protein
MQIAPYFSKVECFCFEEQKLLAGEEVDMPLLFFIDKDLLDDPACRGVDDVVLSYTFFRYALLSLYPRKLSAHGTCDYHLGHIAHGETRKVTLNLMLMTTKFRHHWVLGNMNTHRGQRYVIKK